ncbi:DNA polymerase III subunit alpha [Natronosporangium hydrolyticum]|uniref:DNA polymerase III subunit alpha n=1 Tax=Natronosporangium hydrolyticum TaxID=2811111 RepID=A0A895YA30_9ACTN|nr:DNA polymerase III subunit alpha [Natronosporangium hydrolyticum]QSB14624.1 DNA polymerase III subunit alpha [Natronosporangium hydrolyticum]
MSNQFVHLHVHTEFSILDGAARINDMMTEVQRLGMPAVAITDHGNMHGANAFYKAATAAGVTPVIGIEAYLAPDSRFHKKPVRWGRPEQKDDDVSGGGRYTHATLWATNKTGLHNLFALTSRASLEGQYGKPRMDAELLSEYAGGLVATTGCPSGEVQTRLRLGQEEEALAAAARYQDIFGKENYFLELMDHGLDIETRVRSGLLDISRKLGIPPVVTNDSHYTQEDQASAHDALLCVQTNARITDTKRMRFGGSGYYLKSPAEMYGVDGSDAWLEGCRNTLVIAERVETEGMFAYHDLMPRFPTPEGETEESLFTKEVWAGMARRYPGGIPEDRRAQCQYEVEVISSMGFPAYFLVVADFIRWSRENDISVGPGRGSAAGSIVAYALGITDLDPLTHGLIFERFINPERVERPDIDVDFDERGRAAVIRYVTEKYGDDRVAQIATYGTIKAKAAIKDASRVLGYPYALGDRITKAMPPAVMGKDIPLSAVTDSGHPRYHEATEVRALVDSEPDVAKVFDIARGLEGLVRQTGVHAAGVIMSAEPLIEHIPLMKREDDGAIITQFDYPTCESLGLIKMDFLGLRNLTILAEGLRNVERSTGRRIDLDSLGLDDRPTYELLGRGETLGVFQLDGGPMRSLLKMMRPDNFEDISAAIALYRPGPMGANSHINYALRKTGQQEVVPIHPHLAEALEEVLGPTHGLIVYQEQVMAIAQKLAGYTMGQADNLRKAMGKKKKDVLDKQVVFFRDGMRERGFSDESIQTLWDILLPFADYAFNKAHSAAYGLIAYWTAYLKANYPAEYMAALLTSVSDDKDRMALYLGECRRMGVKVLPPDVNESEGPFKPVDGNIRFGLHAVRNVGTNVVRSIIETRKAKEAFTSFADFLAKGELVVCNKRTIESLIKAGAFDSLGHTRRGLVEVHEAAVEDAHHIKRREAEGQFSLFDDLVQADEPAAGLTLTVPEHEWESKTLLDFEREMLGLYVSSHPLAGAEHLLRRNCEQAITQIEDDELPDGAHVTLAGMIVGLNRRVTKQGKLWASASLEDLDGAIEVLFFPSTYDAVSDQLADDLVVALKGKVNRRDSGSVSVVAHDLAVLDTSAVAAAGGRPVTIRMKDSAVTEGAVERLREVLVQHQGDTEVRLELRYTGNRQPELLKLPRYRVQVSPALMADLKALVGSGSVL